jgi:hypothetical protein
MNVDTTAAVCIALLRSLLQRYTLGLLHTRIIFTHEYMTSLLSHSSVTLSAASKCCPPHAVSL